MKVGFVGLGRMGRAMAGNLLRAGHDVSVYNRTPARAEELRGRGARVAASPADAALGAQAVLTMLADDDAVESVTVGLGAINPSDAIVSGLERGAVHVSMSTIAPATSVHLAQVHARLGQAYVAAPVLGRPEAAEGRQLVVLAAGPSAAVDRCMPLFDALGRKTHRLGQTPERANVVKLGTNYVLASMLGVIGEAFALAEAYGVDAETFLDVANGSLLKSEVLGSYGARIAEGRFDPAGFRLLLGLKDVRLVLETGDAAGLSLPIASVVRDRFVDAMSRGLEDKDWSAVASAVMRRRAA
ncbi:MAG TPA: NAD(P)-dependent oxidoreductase [Polyangiaceae bacterium]|nr:NAD(P)-dependent oxidoreductase [Polyangiaceae bacterium]